jgi:hypothetical protein
VKIGGIGGRCSNNWGGDCICLDKDVCRTKWKGTPYTGTPDNWPCPKDPDNIMACVVKPCLGKVEPSQCLWKEACSQPNPGRVHHFRPCEVTLLTQLNSGRLGPDLPRRGRLPLLRTLLVTTIRQSRGSSRA